MKQLSFNDLLVEEDEIEFTEWKDLTPTGRWFLRGIHPESPRKRKPNPYSRLMKALRQEQIERFAPAKRLSERR